MTDMHASDQDIDPAIRSWLHEDRHEDVARVASAVLDQVEAIPHRRRTRWPTSRRHDASDRLLLVGLGAAAVGVVLVVGIQVVGAPAPVGVGGGTSATTVPSPSPTAETLSPTGSLSAGELPRERTHPLSSTSEPFPGGIASTVSIPNGWAGELRGGIVVKGRALRHAGVLGPWHEPLFVYGDPCQWSTTTPKKPATTVDDVVAALSSQTLRDPSTPVAVTLDGYPGKLITLHVPEELDVADDGTLRGCDRGMFGSWGVSVPEPESLPARAHQLPGQIDEVWVVDIDGQVTVIDGTYYPETSAEDVAEMRAIIESIDFEP